MPVLLQADIPATSMETNENCFFFFYFFLGCYIICVAFLIYTLIRLLKYHLRQRQITALTNEVINRSSSITTTAVILQIHNVNEQDAMALKGELDVLQPLIIQTRDLPPVYIENKLNLPPPDYKEHL